MKKKKLKKLNIVRILLIVFGFIFFAFGLVFWFLPIPLGWIFLILGLVLLSPIPFFRKILDYLERKDKTKFLKGLEKKSVQLDKNLERRFEKK